MGQSKVDIYSDGWSGGGCQSPSRMKMAMDLFMEGDSGNDRKLVTYRGVG